jgi:hypothetical protein
VIFRIARWERGAGSVGVFGGSVAVNQERGEMERAQTEADANGTTEESAWYYDAEEQRLIIKVVPWAGVPRWRWTTKGSKPRHDTPPGRSDVQPEDGATGQA